MLERVRPAAGCGSHSARAFGLSSADIACGRSGRSHGVPAGRHRRPPGSRAERRCGRVASVPGVPPSYRGLAPCLAVRGACGWASSWRSRSSVSQREFAGSCANEDERIVPIGQGASSCQPRRRLAHRLAGRAAAELADRNGGNNSDAYRTAKSDERRRPAPIGSTAATLGRVGPKKVDGWTLHRSMVAVDKRYHADSPGTSIRNELMVPVCKPAPKIGAGSGRGQTRDVERGSSVECDVDVWCEPCSATCRRRPAGAVY